MFKFDLYDKLFGSRDEAYDDYDSYDDLDDVDMGMEQAPAAPYVADKTEHEPKPRFNGMNIEKRRPRTQNRPAPRVLPMHPVTDFDGQEVIIIKPTDFELTQKICNDLRYGKTVICNMQGITKDTARRAADFIMGAAHVLDAHVAQITDGIFVVAPVEVRLDTIDITSANMAAQEQQRARYSTVADKVIDGGQWAFSEPRYASNQ